MTDQWQDIVIGLMMLWLLGLTTAIVVFMREMTQIMREVVAMWRHSLMQKAYGERSQPPQEAP